MKKCLLFIVSLGVLGVTSTQAATLYLKDGSVVRGTIVSATARDVQVHGSQGQQTITTDRISRIDYSDTAAEVRPEPEPQPIPRQRPWRAISGENAAVWQRGQTQYLSFGLGAAIPFNKVDFGSIGGGSTSNGGAGVHFSPQYLFKLGPQSGAGLEVNFSNRSEKVTHNLLPYSDTWVSGNNLLIMPVFKYSFVERGFGRPYVLAGVGAQRSSTFIEAQPHIGFIWDDTNTDEPRTLVDDAHWGIGSTLRLGIDFSWIESSVLGIELGWTHLNNNAFGPTPAGKDLGVEPVSGVQDHMVIAFRWGWRF